jgi:predicted nucleic acid-binding protein
VILVDSNVLMYAAGSGHLHKAPSVRFLESVANGSIDAAVDAEVLQEVLHRYRALGRWQDGRRVYDAARQVFTVVLPVTSDVLDVARRLLDEHPRLSARDALHAAVVRHFDLTSVCSFDRDFDAIPWLERMEPR